MCVGGDVGVDMGLPNHVERSWVCRGEGDEKTKKTILVLTSIVLFWLKAGRDFSHLKNEDLRVKN